MEEAHGSEFTQDGTVDLKGNPILRSKRGGWTACSFIVVYEVFERMAFFGISSNLVLYLTTKLHQGTVASANNVTNWVGASWLTPILGAYVADAHLGRYWTFLIASAIYLSGMCLLTVTVSIPALRAPPCHEANVAECKHVSSLQLAVFYTALYILAIGTGGTKPNISTIGADQFNNFEPKEKAQKISFFNWWAFSVFFGTLVANTFLVYIQDNIGWSLGYGLPTCGLAISIVIFLAGTPFYRHRVPRGSPFTTMSRVLVASLRKWRLHVPNDPKQLYELDMVEYAQNGNPRINATPSLRFLNKAAIKTGSKDPWMLCSVTKVEETKQMLRMIPILIATIMPSTMAAQVHTLFVKQGTTLDRGIKSFQIPPASLTGVVTLSMLVVVVLYDCFIVKLLKKWTKNPRGITLLQRLGIGFIFHILVMVTASLTEMRRLRVAKDHGVVENGGSVPLSILILIPQHVFMGIADAFIAPAQIEFFYDQAPESMKSLGASYSTTSVGIGSFFSSFLLSTVSNFTKSHFHKGWILNNLNASHLDYYYTFLAVLNVLNLIFFIIVARCYVYRAEIFVNSVEVLKESKDSS
ncbi:NRT1/ PTR FAMILY 5.2 [Thalictrum thalictroides]|uniref:NRT1/ PTR FAMILY 5.2 n=1 Tax=Thalictrum thalictroides TaxID=46969 RepID=A0A7J6V2P5_THATH|nr:NRT1/ PTR FAMILY 5.2 [Thalictrum thalictroides]